MNGGECHRRQNKRIRHFRVYPRKIKRLFNRNFAASLLKWSHSLFILRFLSILPDAFILLFLKKVPFRKPFEIDGVEPLTSLSVGDVSAQPAACSLIPSDKSTAFPGN